MKKSSFRFIYLFSLIFSLILFEPYYAFANSTKYTLSKPRLGIDVSHHCGDINWQAVKNAGIEFAILRTSFHGTLGENHVDRQIINNIQGAKSVGMPIGAYHYCLATNVEEAESEAEFFIEQLKLSDKWEYPVFVDVENPIHLTLPKQQRTDILISFMNKVKKSGYFAGYYAFLSWQNNHFYKNQLSSFPLWVAQYGSKCKCTDRYGLWQFSENAVVDGIPALADFDYCYIDYPTMIKDLHKNGY